MQSTKPLYTSIRNIPAGRLLGNADGATGPAQALGDVAARALLGLGTAALAATGDFDAAGAAASVASSLSAHVAAADPHGDRAYAASLVSGLSAVYQPLDSDLTAIAALSTTTYGRALLTLADAAAGQSALGLGNSALATVLATGTDRSVQVRNGTGNSYTDSLLTVAGTTGVASLNGSAAGYRAYGPTGVPYTSLSHDGTNGKVQASSGYLLLASPNGNGLRVVDGTSLVDVQSSQAVVKLLSNASVVALASSSGSVVYGPIIHRVASNCQYGIASDTDAHSIADIAFMRAGANIGEITTGARGARAALYTGNQRIYDTALNTNYLALSHNGTYGDVNTNSGDLYLRSAGSGSYLQVRSSDWYWASAGTAIFYMSSNGLSLASGKQYGFTSGSTGGTNDVAIARRAAGAIESNNGTAGTLRDVYARTFYGIAQAETDTPGCDKGAASQSANLREWQDSTGAVLASVSENGYFTTRKNAAPADAEIATGESAYWFDSTNGAAKFMIKAKQADGTVVTGSVALA